MTLTNESQDRDNYGAGELKVWYVNLRYSGYRSPDDYGPFTYDDAMAFGDKTYGRDSGDWWVYKHADGHTFLPAAPSDGIPVSMAGRLCGLGAGAHEE